MNKYILLIALLILSQENYSQTDTVFSGTLTDTVVLEETLIEAYKANRLMPLTFKDLTKGEIDILNSGQEPSAILNLTPSINSYSDAGNYQGYSYFRLRGVDQTRINMTLDGIPLNEPEDQGAYFSNFPDFFNSIQTMQIQRGTGTSSNGVAGYAGSINFQSPGLGADHYSEFGATYGSFNTYRVYGEFNSGIKQHRGLYVRLSKLGSDGYKYHSGNQSGSAFVSMGIFKSRYKLKLTGFAGNQRNELAWIGVPLDTINKKPKTNGNSNEKDHFSQVLVSIQNTYEVNANININSTLYYNYLKGNYDFDLNNFLGYPSTNEMFNYAFEHNFIGAFTNISATYKNIRIYGGIHLNAFSRVHTGSEKSSGQLYENTGLKNEFSSFIKLTYTVSKIVLFGDVQYRHTNFNYEGTVPFEKINWFFLNPKMGLNFNIRKNTSIYYSFGNCGREPTRNDLFNGEDNLAADSSGNPAYLKISPEFVYDQELGFKTQNGSLYLAANVYLMNFKNEIVLNGQYGPNGLPLHSNVAQSYRSGFEFDVKVSFLSDLYYSVNTSVSHNRISESSIIFQPILTPQIICNQVLGYKNSWLHAGIVFKYQGQSYIDFENIHTTPGFFTIDLFAGYRLKHFNFRVNLNNLTNETIIANGYIGFDGTPLYFVQAPFNFNAGIEWIF
jgi:iron complex outermembrane recepter protein